LQLLNVGGKSRRQLASILSVIASSFFLLFFNYSFSTFLELNHIQFSLQLISIMLEYFEWGFCMCSLLWRNEKGKGKLKTETIVLVWFFCEEKNQSRSNPSNLLNRRFCPVSSVLNGFPVLWQNGFQAISDRTWARFTVRTVELAGPVRFNYLAYNWLLRRVTHLRVIFGFNVS